MNKNVFIKTKKTKITYSNILRSRKYERKKKKLHLLQMTFKLNHLKTD